MPNSAVPYTFAGVSSRPIGLPTTLNSPGGLRATSLGGVRPAALSATCPYVSFLPLEWMITPLSARQVDASTPHVCAAALTSIVRACAPACRSLVHPSRTLVLPPVSCPPSSSLM